MNLDNAPLEKTTSLTDNKDIDASIYSPNKANYDPVKDACWNKGQPYFIFEIFVLFTSVFIVLYVSLIFLFLGSVL